MVVGSPLASSWAIPMSFRFRVQRIAETMSDQLRIPLQPCRHKLAQPTSCQLATMAGIDCPICQQPLLANPEELCLMRADTTRTTIIEHKGIDQLQRHPLTDPLGATRHGASTQRLPAHTVSLRCRSKSRSQFTRFCKYAG